MPHAIGDDVFRRNHGNAPVSVELDQLHHFPVSHAIQQGIGNTLEAQSQIRMDPTAGGDASSGRPYEAVQLHDLLQNVLPTTSQIEIARGYRTSSVNLDSAAADKDRWANSRRIHFGADPREQAQARFKLWTVG